MKVLILLAFLGGCLAQYNPHMVPGRTSIVHLFEWRWTDIAAECERYLAPNGFGGVQISPPNEHIVLNDPWRPWWERYQPISYNLCSRSGNEVEFRDMVTRCNNVGVRIYADVVINHMCGASGGSGTHSSCGSYFDAGSESFPAVPYSSWDFNDGKCRTSSGNIENYNDIHQVRDCRLVSLLDLALQKDYVRGKIAEYLNNLIDLGVAGFRVDACKHMWPRDMEAVFRQLNNLNTRWFNNGSKAFIYQEVIDLGSEVIKSSQYFGLGRVTEFKYSAKLGTVVRRWNGEKMAYLRNWGEGWAFMPTDRALVFVDNHDNQRGHGPGGASILTFWDSRLYKVAVAFMLAHPYGQTRVMSSFRWDRYFVNGKALDSAKAMGSNNIPAMVLKTCVSELATPLDKLFQHSYNTGIYPTMWKIAQDVNDWMGPPSNSDGSTKHVTLNADTTCGNGWVCEHRWRQIRNMVIFRNVVDGHLFTNWWDNGSNQIAFGRGNRGFIAINNDNWNMGVTLQTGLPAGTYCDVISGQKEGDRCTGLQVDVGPDGRVSLQISNTAEDPMLAIHVDAKL